MIKTEYFWEAYRDKLGGRWSDAVVLPALTTLLVIQWNIVNIPEPQNFHVVYLYD